MAKFLTNAIGATWWPNFFLIQVTPPGGWISNKCMWYHLFMFTKFASYKVPPVMVSTHGSVVPLAMFLERTILKPFFLSSLGHLGLLSSLDTHGNIVFEILISQHIAYVGVLKHFYLYICFSVCHLWHTLPGSFFFTENIWFVWSRASYSRES